MNCLYKNIYEGPFIYAPYKSHEPCDYVDVHVHMYTWYGQLEAGEEYSVRRVDPTGCTIMLTSL